MYNQIEIAKEFAERIKLMNKTDYIVWFSCRGGDKEDSDIDILIIADNEEELEDFVSEEVIDILLTTKQYISALIMSENHFNDTKEFSFLSNVLDDGMTIG